MVEIAGVCNTLATTSKRRLEMMFSPENIPRREVHHRFWRLGMAQWQTLKAGTAFDRSPLPLRTVLANEGFRRSRESARQRAARAKEKPTGYRRRAWGWPQQVEPKPRAILSPRRDGGTSSLQFAARKPNCRPVARSGRMTEGGGVPSRGFRRAVAVRTCCRPAGWLLMCHHYERRSA